MSVVNYQRFQAHSIFGLIGTGNSVVFITRQSHVRRYVAVTACQLVLIWDTRKQTKVATLQCPDVEGIVQLLAVQPPTDNSLNNSNIAAGYSSGEIVVFSIKQNSAIDPIVFAGHKGVVSSLAWDNAGMRLASAGVDGEIVIWDTVSERGIIRLRGHKGVVTRVLFLTTRDGLVSAGKDGAIKFWDVPTGHCYRTLAPLTAEVWDIALLRSDTRLVVGGNDACLDVWGLSFKDPTAPESVSKETKNETEDGADSNKHFCLDTEGEAAPLPVIEGQPLQLPTDDASQLAVENLGRLQRSRGGRVAGLSSSRSGNVLACYGRHNCLDLYSVLDEDQVQERVRKRLKKTRKRLRESGATETETAISEEPQLGDEMRSVACVAVHDKLSSVCVAEEGSTAYLAMLYTNNSIAVLHADMAGTAAQGDQLSDNTSCHMTLAGHRADVRAVQFSSVGDTIVSLSNDALKTWYRSDAECQCTGTAALPGLVRSLVLAPGDKYAILGAASGHIWLVELATGALVEDIAGAHCAEEEGGRSDVTALSLTADSKGLVSGGLDQTVRMWRFELVSDESAGRRLTLESASDTAIKLHDGVTALHCSPDAKLLAVATLDNKETLYYVDTMKLHQELYGKSLPSTCLSFNHPGTLVVTGSKDCAIRIYGTDFGDMRKMIKNAHTGGVTSIKFQAQTNLFFSTGNDGLLNYWDADSFQRIMTLRGHSGIARCLSVAPKGNWVVTGGQDHSLRLWERTQEILNLQEEREEERRRLEEEGLGEEELLAGQKRHVEGETRDSEAVRASKPTAKTEEAVDQILAGLRMYQSHLNNPDAPPHYLMLSYGIMDPVECFAEVLGRIKSSLLEEAIVQLELSQVLSLLVVLARMCKRNLLTEASVRVAIIAVRTNMPQLAASNTALPFVTVLAKHITNFTKAMQDKVGFTTAGLRQCIERHEVRHETQLFADAFDRHAATTKKKKKKELASRRARLAIS